MSVSEVYPLVYATNINAGSSSEVETADPADETGDGGQQPGAVTTAENPKNVLTMTADEFVAWSRIKHAEHQPDPAAAAAAVEMSNNKKRKGSGAAKSLTLRQLLLSQDSGVSHFGPDVLDHCIVSAGLRPALKLDQVFALETIAVKRLLAEVARGMLLVAEMSAPAGEHKGYIVLKDAPTAAAAVEAPVTDNDSTTEQQPPVEFAEFVSFLFAQHAGRPVQAFPSFNEAVDEYFCKVEGQRLLRGAASAEEAARKKIEKVRSEQAAKLRGLEQQQERMERNAMLLELHAEEVEKACLVLNSALGAGMDWEDIQRMVDAEKAAGNPVALLVSKLRLDRNRVVLRLRNEEPAVDALDSQDHPSAVPTAEAVPASGPPAPKKAKKMINMFDSDSDDEVQEEAEEEDNKSKAVETQADAVTPAVATSDDATTAVTAPTTTAEAAPVTQGGASKGKSSSAPASSLSAPSAWMEVEVDLALSAFANARNMYTYKKSAAAKEAKTVEIADRVLQSVEQQTLKALEGQKIKRSLLAVRKVHWFEKFNWFLTSEGYLVLSGRDAQQNELLFKRYLRPCDVYVHADLSGASSCVVRAKDTSTGPDSAGGGDTKPISPLAIQEAGIMAVCRSLAWTAKVVTSAWWVWAHQVSKTAPSGEFLTTGSFMVYGKKNFLPPMALEMGFGLLFRLEDSCVGRHLHDRRDHDYSADLEAMSVLTDAIDRYALDAPEEEGEAEAGEEVSEDAPDEDALVGDANDAAFSGSDSDSLAAGNSNGHSVSSKQIASFLHAAGAESVGGGSVTGSVRSGVSSQIIQSIVPNGAREPTKQQQQRLHQQQQVEDHGRKMERKKGTAGRDKEDRRAGRKGKKDESPERAASAGSRDDKPVQQPQQSQPPAKKKHIDKRKARRYAEQDEDDRERAMLVLGHHARDGEKLSDKLAKSEKARAQRDLQAKQDKAGIRFVQEDWGALVALLHPEVQAVLGDIVARGLVREGEIDAYEMKALAAFPPQQGLDVLALFSEGKHLSTVGNKSGFLAGIMRRFAKESASNNNIQSVGPSDQKNSSDSPATSSQNSGEAAETEKCSVGATSPPTAGDECNHGDGEEGDGEQQMSRRERKRAEQREIQEILEAEGALEEEAGRQADELEKLTGCPLPDDKLLYAVPVCGPYVSMQSFKFRVKLTPGTAKKGKAAKQALDVFAHSKESTAGERAAMKGLTDPEVVAIMIGDVKLSMPGLFQKTKAAAASSQQNRKSRGQKKK